MNGYQHVFSIIIITFDINTCLTQVQRIILFLNKKENNFHV